MSTSAVQSAQFRRLAQSVGGTDAALMLLQGLNAGEQSLNAERLAESHGLDVAVLKQLAALSGTSEWVGQVRAEGGQVRAEIAAGSPPQTAANPGATLARNGRVQVTVAEFVKQNQLDRGLPLDKSVEQALKAKYPLKGRLADEFPEGPVADAINSVQDLAMKASFSLGIAGTGRSGASGLAFYDAQVAKVHSTDTVIDFLVTLAAQKPDLARAVLCDVRVRKELASIIQTPAGAARQAEIELLAKMPLLTTDAELAESGTARVRRAIDTGLQDLVPAEAERGALVDALVALRHPAADHLVVTPRTLHGHGPVVGFVHDGLACGKALTLDGKPALLEDDRLERAIVRVDLRTTGMAALAALVALNARQLRDDLGAMTVNHLGLALASQGPFSTPPAGVALVRESAGGLAVRLLFTLVDANDQPIGNGVKVYQNAVSTPLDEAPFVVQPRKDDRNNPVRGYTGIARFA